MNFYYTIHVVEDGCGNKCGAVSEHRFGGVYITGMIKDGKLFSFGSEAKHLKEWCETHGFKYTKIDKMEEV
jgi:dissimilatory sulfite reductase (desulfoviridin) alpha/beta subunit